MWRRFDVAVEISWIALAYRYPGECRCCIGCLKKTVQLFPELLLAGDDYSAFSLFAGLSLECIGKLNLLKAEF